MQVSRARKEDTSISLCGLFNRSTFKNLERYQTQAQNMSEISLFVESMGGKNK